jgi:hypothetical protein
LWTRLWSSSTSSLGKIDTTIGFLTLRSLWQVLFQIFIPGLTTVSLLESKSGFWIVTQFADTGKTIIFASLGQYKLGRIAVYLPSSIINHIQEEKNMDPERKLVICCFINSSSTTFKQFTWNRPSETLLSLIQIYSFIYSNKKWIMVIKSFSELFARRRICGSRH